MKKALQGLIFFVFLFSVNVLQADEKTEKKIKVTINSAELTEYVKVPSAPITEPIDKDSKPKSDESKPEDTEAKTDQEKKAELIIFNRFLSL